MPELLQLCVEAVQLAKQDSKQLFEAAGFKKPGSHVIARGGLTGYGELNNVITFMECHLLILKLCV
ncbi:mCG8027, isoform CRA_b [Mus musculus]|nr:mCG8027, isoform CRA_b [Mus musculus]